MPTTHPSNPLIKRNRTKLGITKVSKDCLSSKLRGLLESQIVSGQLKPGMKLDEQTLAKKFKASRTPVREALRQLESLGMVQNIPRHGSQVVKLDLQALIEMFETMAYLEAACAGLAARRHTENDRKKLLEAHEACNKAFEKSNPDKFYLANSQFHEIIYAASQNKFLFDQTLSLRNRLEPYRRETTFHAGLMVISIKEHEKIMNSILDMNETEAMKGMLSHLDTLRNDAIKTYNEMIALRS